MLIKLVICFEIMIYIYQLLADGDTLKKYSYGQLNRLSNQLARTLCNTIRQNKLPRNNDEDYIVAVSMYPSDRLVVTLLAIWKSGAAYLPLDPSFPKPRVEHIVGESKPAIVIYDEGIVRICENWRI